MAESSRVTIYRQVVRLGGADNWVAAGRTSFERCRRDELLRTLNDEPFAVEAYRVAVAKERGE